MKSVLRKGAVRRNVSAQAIYQTMLIIAAVALAAAVFFPLHEYLTLLHGEVAPYKFDQTASLPGAAAPTPAPPAQAAPAGKAAEAGAKTGAPAGAEEKTGGAAEKTKEAGGEAPAPVEEAQPEAPPEGG